MENAELGRRRDRGIFRSGWMRNAGTVETQQGRQWNCGRLREELWNRGGAAVGTGEWLETGIRTGAGGLVSTGRRLRDNTRENKQINN